MIKRCSMCAATYTREAFAALEYVGLQDQGPYYPMTELRNCPCGSTLCEPDEWLTPAEVADRMRMREIREVAAARRVG